MTEYRLHGCQVRAARAMLMWSVRQLAQQSGVSESSIRRVESEFGIPKNVTLDLLVRLREFFEGKGFRFTLENGEPGVHWHRKERRRSDRRGGGGVPSKLDGPADETDYPTGLWLGRGNVSVADPVAT